jgi:MoxR-like ATPase
MNDDAMSIAACVDGVARARSEIGNVIVGQAEAVEFTLLALLCEGHVLYEGVPGLGKTSLVKALGDTMKLSFSRIQFTPDLMPSDVAGTTLIERSERGDLGLAFEPGPIFANLILADEINRASPKTQSALLEAMQERAVTVRGRAYPLPRPFLVLATQNPLEMEGTYPLPEAQIDRFLFKVIIEHPGKQDLERIVERTVGQARPQAAPVMRQEDIMALQAAVRDVVVPPQVLSAAADIVLTTRPECPEAPEAVKRYVRYGAGPRAAQAMVMAAKARALLAGRFNASMEDLLSCAVPAVRHRLALNFDGLSEGLRVEDVLQKALEAVAETAGAARA